MYRVEVHKTINQFMELFYRLGFWHCGDDPTVKETRMKQFYSIYYFLFPISLMAGAIKSDNKNESIFLVEIAILAAVMSVKMFYIIWNKREIIDLLHTIGIYSIEDHKDFGLVNHKLKSFMKFVTVLLCGIFICGACVVLVVPFLGNEKKLYFNVGFPLDYKNNEVAYWVAFTFFSTEIILSDIAFLFTIMIWYLMLNCGLKYEILGNQMQNMGVIKTVAPTGNKRIISDSEKQNLFQRDLMVAITCHQDIRKYIDA